MQVVVAYGACAPDMTRPGYFKRKVEELQPGEAHGCLTQSVCDRRVPVKTLDGDSGQGASDRQGEDIAKLMWERRSKPSSASTE